MSEPARPPAGALALAPARGTDDLAAVRTLFREYADWLGLPDCFQAFDEELAALPRPYEPPAGELLLARIGGGPAGVVGVRPLGDGTAEMKRLWVRPAFRGRGLGRLLTEAAMEIAATRGYRALRLDTLPTLRAAMALYRTLGFVDTPPYLDRHPEGAVCMARFFQGGTDGGSLS